MSRDDLDELALAVLRRGGEWTAARVAAELPEPPTGPGLSVSAALSRLRRAGLAVNRCENPAASDRVWFWRAAIPGDRQSQRRRRRRS